MRLVVEDPKIGTPKQKFKKAVKIRLIKEPLIFDNDKLDKLKSEIRTKAIHFVTPNQSSTEAGWGEWKTYKLSEGAIKDKAQKISYECYCCGFLSYYDDIVRNGMVNHQIYFKWSGFEKVVVYINPAPKRAKQISKKKSGHKKLQMESMNSIGDNEVTAHGIDPQPPPTPPPPPPTI